MNHLIRKRLTKHDVFTIPNAISLLRLLLIPFIVAAFIADKNLITVGLILFSGLSDIADGIIARRFHMISDLGKLLDPVADKATQLTLIFCLASRYSFLYWFAAFFILRELLMFIFGLLVLRKTDSVHSSRWYGKAATVLLYAVMLAVLMLPDLPAEITAILFLLCVLMMAYSLACYLMLYAERLHQNALPHSALRRPEESCDP